jgi:hypothetical protein
LLNKAWLLVWLPYGVVNPNKGAQKQTGNQNIMKNIETANVSEFVLGWNENAVNLAKNLGLNTRVVIMPGGYHDRLYVSGVQEKMSVFRSFPQVKRNPDGGCFSPGVSMPQWTDA